MGTEVQIWVRIPPGHLWASSLPSLRLGFLNHTGMGTELTHGVHVKFSPDVAS